MTDTTISPFTAAFLAADQIAKPGGAMNSIHAPVTDAKVNFSDLCAKMFAYTFLCLLDDGAIDITLTNRKALFGTKNQALIQKKRETTQVSGGTSLLAAVRDGKSVHDAVYSCLGGSWPSPWKQVVQAVFKEASAAGLLVSAGDGIGTQVTGLPKIRPVPEQQAEIATIASGCAQRWKRFEGEHADLAQQLVLECYSGINGRVNKSGASYLLPSPAWPGPR